MSAISLLTKAFEKLMRCDRKLACIGTFRFPNSVAVDADWNVYVTDTIAWKSSMPKVRSSAGLVKMANVNERRRRQRHDADFLQSAGEYVHVDVPRHAASQKRRRRRRQQPPP
ncbi:MAG TPA: hypothetical protein VK419_12345 [Bryobacteraceae bacterium]|nr:hypothetical protein [Bryobacteraceae bacterium]